MPVQVKVVPHSLTSNCPGTSYGRKVACSDRSENSSVFRNPNCVGWSLMKTLNPAAASFLVTRFSTDS